MAMEAVSGSVRESSLAHGNRVDATGEAVIDFIMRLEFDERRAEVFYWNVDRTRRCFIPVSHPAVIDFLRRSDQIKAAINEPIKRDGPVLLKQVQVVALPQVPTGYLVCRECQGIGLGMYETPCDSCEGNGIVRVEGNECD